MYKTFARTKIEHASIVANPWLIKDIDILERVQAAFTARLPECINLDLRRGKYKERLQFLKLESLEERRIKDTLKFAYKIIHKMIDADFAGFFQFSTASTRQNGTRMIHSRHRLKCREEFFSLRAERLWNQLSTTTILAPSFSQFKKALDTVESQVISNNIKGSKLR